MKRSTSPRFTLLMAGALTFGALSSAHADITIEERMSVEGAGAMAMANMNGTTKTSISGQKSRTESDMQMQSRMVRMFARGAGQSTEIVRLDQDKILEVDTQKKQYTEISLADKRAELAKAMQQMQEAQDKQPSATGMDESDCEWSDSKVDLKKTGEKATIAGYNANQILITASQSCKSRKTGAVCEMSLSLDQWLAPDFDGGGEEAMKFYQAYAEKMGFAGAGSRDARERAEAMFGRYKGMWSELVDKMKDVKGYPVRSSFALGFGGPQCETAQEAANLPAPPPPGSMGGAMAQAAGEAVGQAAAAKAGESALGGIAGQFGGKIAGSLFKKKQEKKAAQQEQTAPAAAAPVASNGLITPLRVTSELVAVKTDAIPAETFEVPAGYKKTAQDK